jgi:hypothetical protein
MCPKFCSLKSHISPKICPACTLYLRDFDPNPSPLSLEGAAFWLLAACWLSAGCLLAACWPPANCLLAACWLPAGCLLAACWLSAVCLLSACWLAAGWLLSGEMLRRLT